MFQSSWFSDLILQTFAIDEFIVWNIKGLLHHVVKINELEKVYMWRDILDHLLCINLKTVWFSFGIRHFFKESKIYTTMVSSEKENRILPNSFTAKLVFSRNFASIF